ncbi:MAG: hypothetical protein QNK70_06035 [Crocinitomicaceae bacterium]|mgnify:FL=1
MDDSRLIKAVIDIGTNTFNLLIAEKLDIGITVIESHKVAVSLGMGGINEGYLTEDAMNRAMRAFEVFREKLLPYDVKPVLIATSAVRDAKNAKAFVDIVKEDFGWGIDVISGDQEAQLIYRGVTLCFPFNEHAMIMDIGGGSTEFIEADQYGVMSAISLNIGVSRLYQGFSVQDPLTIEDIDQIENFLEENSEGFFDEMQVDTLIGSSGTFETFYELIYRKPFPEGSEVLELELKPFEQSLDTLIHSTLEERNKNEFIIPIRKKMAPFAAVKTRWVMRKLKPKKVILSPFSLKEGALV